MSASPACGLWLQAALACTAGGQPLGLSGLEVRDRSATPAAPSDNTESKRWLRGFESTCELGRLSSQARVIAVGDRESNIYELFLQPQQQPAAAGLLVRANASRHRQVQVWNQACQKPVLRPHGPHRTAHRLGHAAVDP